MTWLPFDDEPVKVAENSGIEATTIDQDGSGDTPEKIDRRKCAPAIAVDRVPDPNDVYVAFYARAASALPYEDQNTDIYISRSTDGGETFPNLPTHLVHLTDLMLTGQEGGVHGPDQVMPSIEIDACGGVSLVFYDNRNDPDLSDDDHWLDLYYVRITDFGTQDQYIYQQRLTAPEPLDPAGFLIPENYGPFLGDYHHMAIAGPLGRTLYPAYIATAKDEQGDWTQQNCYLHKISILCLSDLNLNGESDPQDVALFETAYDSRERAADVNRDGAVDQRDHTLFWDVYRNGCERR